MQRSTQTIWGLGFAFTGLGLLLFTLGAEPERRQLSRADGIVQSVQPMKTGQRLALAGNAQSFGFVLRGPGCENARGILQLQGKPATLLYQATPVEPSTEAPYLPLYAVYQGDTPLCSYEAMRRSQDTQKRLSRYFAWGALALGALVLAGAWRRRPAPPAAPGA